MHHACEGRYLWKPSACRGFGHLYAGLQLQRQSIRPHGRHANASLRSTQVYVVLELMTGGELFEKVAMDGPLPEAAGRRVFQQLLDGLAHCHAHGVCHRCVAAGTAGQLEASLTHVYSESAMRGKQSCMQHAVPMSHRHIYRYRPQ